MVNPKCTGLVYVWCDLFGCVVSTESSTHRLRRCSLCKIRICTNRICTNRTENCPAQIRSNRWLELHSSIERYLPFGLHHIRTDGRQAQLADAHSVGRRASRSERTHVFLVATRKDGGRLLARPLALIVLTQNARFRVALGRRRRLRLLLLLLLRLSFLVRTQQQFMFGAQWAHRFHIETLANQTVDDLRCRHAAALAQLAEHLLRLRLRQCRHRFGAAAKCAQLQAGRRATAVALLQQQQRVAQLVLFGRHVAGRFGQPHVRMVRRGAMFFAQVNFVFGFALQHPENVLFGDSEGDGSRFGWRRLEIWFEQSQ